MLSIPIVLVVYDVPRAPLSDSTLYTHLRILSDSYDIGRFHGYLDCCQQSRRYNVVIISSLDAITYRGELGTTFQFSKKMKCYHENEKL